MLPIDEQHECDDRFATGEWKGFFVQPDSRHRHAMDLVLEFGRGKISGIGEDFVGRFTIRGTYDTQTSACMWTKQYIGQHSVQYTGQARQGGIIGQWRIPGLPVFWTGPFFVWPGANGDLESEFERAFLEYDLLLSPEVSSPELVEA